jgi:dCMP deaminase
MTDATHQPSTRPDREEYYMAIAMAVRSRADCVGNRVGAVLVLDDRIISTGYNGTPANMKNCTEGGCERCLNRDKYASGTFYDLCICVHAEQNAILAAARFGIATEGAVLYSTMQPCFGCTKELLQAGVRAVNYLHEWVYPEPEMQASYATLQGQFADGVRVVKIEDDRAVWAISRMRADS